eukprot:14636429-Alexandrium_andersonii.AAC.1
MVPLARTVPADSVALEPFWIAATRSPLGARVASVPDLSDPCASPPSARLPPSMPRALSQPILAPALGTPTAIARQAPSRGWPAGLQPGGKERAPGVPGCAGGPAQGPRSRPGA